MTQLMEVVRHLLSVAMASQWLLLILFVAAAVDAVFPVVPSEGMVVTAGMAAAAGHQNLLLVIVVAMVGSVIGESFCYFLGRGSGPALRRWMRRRDARQAIYEKVSHALHTRGGLVLMTVRYIPGARMVATLTAGATAYSFRKFIVFTIAGVTIAYTYVAMLGYIGGDAFAHDSLKALAFSLGLAFLIGLVLETSRRIAGRRKPPQPLEQQRVLRRADHLRRGDLHPTRHPLRQQHRTPHLAPEVRRTKHLNSSPTRLLE